ncbi:MAG: hypothetical protein AAGD38_09305 [Acidobacteriota bacterium]
MRSQHDTRQLRRAIRVAQTEVPLPESLGSRLQALALPQPTPRVEATLDTARSASQLPLPSTLAARLRAILDMARPRPPAWIRDGRLALAACAFLTVGLNAMVASPVTAGIAKVGAQTAAWIESEPIEPPSWTWRLPAVDPNWQLPAPTMAWSFTPTEWLPTSEQGSLGNNLRTFGASCADLFSNSRQLLIDDLGRHVKGDPDDAGSESDTEHAD